MNALGNTEERVQSKSPPAGAGLAHLVTQVRLALIVGVDAEFLQCEELAALEVTTAQFVILKNVLKGSAESACELCKLMDYDRGAMSRMIDRLEARGLIRRVPLAHTRRTVALEVTAAGVSAFPMMEACLSRVMARLVQGIPEAQIREVETVLKRMLENA